MSGVSCKLDQAQAMLSNSDRLEQEHSVAFTGTMALLTVRVITVYLVFKSLLINNQFEEV